MFCSIQQPTSHSSMIGRQLYSQLQSESESDDPESQDNSPFNRFGFLFYLGKIVSLLLPWAFAIVLTCIIIHDRGFGSDRFGQHKLFPSQLTYSPAQNEIQYELRMHHTNIIDAPEEFQGPPSHTLDHAWDKLFNCTDLWIFYICHNLLTLLLVGISTISEQQAMLLTNYTSPVPGHEDEFITELDVFHQLHCLVSFTRPHLSETFTHNCVLCRISCEKLLLQYI